MIRTPYRLAALIALPALLAAAEPAVAAGAPSQQCPAWAAYPKDVHANAASPYLGCSNGANLSAMVEDRNDLAKGRDLAPANARRESDAVKRYEEGKVKTPTPAPSAIGGIVLTGNASGGSQ